MFYFIIKFLLLPVALLFLCCLMWRYYNRALRDITNPAPLPPGSFGLPFIGETYLFIYLKTRFFYSKMKKHGSVYKTHLFGSPTIRITKTDDIHTVLRDERQNLANAWPRSAHLLLQGGLALETSDIAHRRKRKLILRAFSRQELSRYTPIMLETCTQYVKRWMMTSYPVYLYPELRNLTFHIACRCLLGVSPSQEDLCQIMELFETFVNGIFSLPIQIPGFAFYKAMKARQKLLRVIDLYLCKQRKTNDKTETNTILGSDWASTYSGNVTTEDIQSICLELLFAGHESTASAAATMIINACKYSKAYEDIRREVKDFKVSQLTYDVINDFRNLRSVVKESLRLNPPIGAGYRRVVKTFTCKDYQVPKGWTFIYGIRESHKSSSMTSSPETFSPERWFSEEPKLKGGFLTFGAGRRKCVGRHFAELFLKIFLVVLVQNCKVRLLNDDVKLNYFPVPHPIENLPVAFDDM